MSDKDLSTETAFKEHESVLKKSEKTLKDIEHALKDIKATKDSIQDLADSVGISIDQFNQLSTNNLEKAGIPTEQHKEVMDLAQKFIQEEEKTAAEKADVNPAKKGSPAGKKMHRKGLKI